MSRGPGDLASDARCRRSNASFVSGLALTISLGAATFSPIAMAQVSEPDVFYSAISIAGVAVLKTDLDGGGTFQWAGASVGGVLGWHISPEFSAGLTLRYAYEDWTFSTPNALSSVAPWGEINAPSVGLNFRYRPEPDLSLFFAPQIQWNYESGASAGDAQNYGAVIGVTKVFSPTLTLGFGVGVFQLIDQAKAFPFVLVNWQINDKWRLSNPLQAGPTGGPGIEIAYAIGNGWDVAGAWSSRQSRFRLRADGPSPNGIGLNQGSPLFARLSYRLGPQGKINFYAGAIVGGQLKLLDASGNTISSSGFKPAPLLGLSASLTF